MGVVNAVNLELKNDLSMVIRRPFPVADETLLKPETSNAFVDGEWLEVNDSGKLVRGTGSGGVKVYPVHAEKGAYDVRAINKVPVLYLGQYEAETTIVDTTGLAEGDKLMVADVSISSVTRRGLKKSTGASGVVEVGYVSKLISANKIRFVHQHNWKVA